MTPSQSKKVGKVMHEFKHGRLYSGSGHKVTDRDQAIAIALSEAGVSKKAVGGLTTVMVVPYIMKKGGSTGVAGIINWLMEDF